MVWKRAVLAAVLSLSILPFAHAADKSSASAEEAAFMFGTDKADRPVKKETKRSKGWYPFVKHKQWYPFIGQSSAPQAAGQPTGLERREREEQQAPPK